MAQTQNRVLPEHSWPGVAHYGFDLLAAVVLVAMHRTVRARRLFTAEPAAIQSHCGIIQKSFALGAETVGGGVIAVAITLNHRGHRSQLAHETFAGGIAG